MDEENIFEQSIDEETLNEIDSPEPLEEENLNVPLNSTISKNEKMANILGVILGLVVSTGTIGLALSFFLTFIPEIHFTFLHFLKCWTGAAVFPLMRGMLNTKF